MGTSHTSLTVAKKIRRAAQHWTATLDCKTPWGITDQRNLGLPASFFKEILSKSIISQKSSVHHLFALKKLQGNTHHTCFLKKYFEKCGIMASLACSCLNGDLAYVECILWDCIRSQPIATYLWGVPKKRPEEVLQKGRQAWQNAFNYTTMVLEQEPFTPFSSQGIFAPKMFYTISFSHWMTLTLTPDRFYTKQFLHQKSFDYSTGVLKREPFTAKSCFSPGTFIPKKFCTIFFFYTGRLLHQKMLTRQTSYVKGFFHPFVWTKRLLQQKMSTPATIYTKDLLH